MWAAVERSTEPQFKLQRRFVVRGHFRNQACGTGYKEHKTIWIEPYWKGPTDGDILTHVYKPERTEENHA